ncbi:MAG: hypothetical protein ICV78_19065 [Tolypothrix sp. Co-bin9]|nr:hypothetical protein [Tolypothrix sp. Co-bin9]
MVVSGAEHKPDFLALKSDRACAKHGSYTQIACSTILRCVSPNIIFNKRDRSG